MSGRNVRYGAELRKRADKVDTLTTFNTTGTLSGEFCASVDEMVTVPEYVPTVMPVGDTET